MVRADWKYELAHSYGDEMIRIGELSQARGKQLNPILNRPGNLSFNYPLKGELANDIKRDVTAIIAVKNDVAVWSGPVWQTKESTDGSKINVTAVGWPTLLDKRLVRRNIAYTAVDGTDDGQIAFDLIDHVNDHDGSLGLTLPSNLIKGEIVPARSISFIKKGAFMPGPDGAVYRPVPRRQTYTAWQNYVGPSIQQLSDVEDGFDYWPDPVTVELNIARKRMRDLPNVIFGWKKMTENLTSAERDGDSSKAMNFMRVMTSAGIVNVPADESIARIGYREEVANLVDVQLGGSDPTDTLDLGAAYGAAETNFRMWGEEIFVIQPQMLSSGGSVPSIFEDFDLGDMMTLAVDEGRFVTTKEQRFRFFGVNISIDEEGNEKLSNMQIYWGGGGG
jgi:hypothetical protein